jgi:hypothetical protein
MGGSLNALGVTTNTAKPSDLIKGQKTGQGAATPIVEAQRTILTLESLREKLKELEAQYQTTEIGTKAFMDLRKAIEDTNYQIGRASGEIWNGAKQSIIDLTEKGVAPFGTVTLKAGEILRQSFLPALQGSVGTFEQVQESLRRYNEEMQLLTMLGAQFGSIFTSSFNAAMENGTNFFTEMRNAIGNYIKQMLVALGVTAALALVISSIMPNVSFGKAFKGVSGGTGLGSIFGEGGIIELVASLKGFDLAANSNRAGKGLGILR